MIKKVALASGIAAVGLVLAACSSTPTTQSTPSQGNGFEHGANWSYSGATGPENWGSLAPEYATCSQGKLQSPIDIQSPTATNNANPVTNYRGDGGIVVNDGHKIQMNIISNTSEITIDGKKFVLEQTHYHSPSENTIDGKAFPIEFHFVHKAADGTGAALAVFVTPGAANPAWQPFIDAAQKVVPGEEDSEVVKINWSQLVPSALSNSVRFMGSLTTPPCPEGIVWVVDPQPVTMSQAQVDALTGVYSGNARPVQPLNGREVTSDKAAR